MLSVRFIFLLLFIQGCFCANTNITQKNEAKAQQTNEESASSNSTISTPEQKEKDSSESKLQYVLLGLCSMALIIMTVNFCNISKLTSSVVRLDERMKNASTKNIEDFKNCIPTVSLEIVEDQSKKKFNKLK